MVVEAALGTALGIAAIPHAHVHGKDGRFIRAADSERMAGEQTAQGLGVDPSPVEGRVEAAPAATMRCLEAQVDGRREGALRGEDGLGEFEEGVTPTVEAFVERAAEAVESIGRFHDAPIMHSPRALRIPCPTPELKRKLRTSSAAMAVAPWGTAVRRRAAR